MSRKTSYTVILIMLMLGVFFIILVTSLIIRQPTLISGDTQSQISKTFPVTGFTSTELSALPVFTATSNISSPQVGNVQGSATSQPASKPTEKSDSNPTPASNTAEINEDTSLFCGMQGRIILFGFTIEPNNNDNVNISLIRYILFDFDNKQIRLLSLPNSLIVNGKTIEMLNLSSPSLNDLYNYTVNNLSQTELIPEDIGANMLARVLFEQMGIVPDYWVVLYARDVVEIINQFDPIVIPENHENTSYDDSELWERLSQSDLAEQDRILQVLINRLHEPAMLIKIPVLAAKFQDLSFSDIDRQMYLNLICGLENTLPENIEFKKIHDKNLLENEGGYQIIDGSEVKLWVEKEFLDQ